MTRTRYLLSAFGLFALCAAATAVYLSQNLPELLEAQVRNYLQQYGVEAFEYRGLHVSQHSLSVDRAHLRGSYGNYSYELMLTAGEVRFHWAALLRAKLDQINLSAVDLRVTDNGNTAASGSAGTIDFNSLAPAQWLAERPVDRVAIPRLSLHYRTADAQVLEATGALYLAERLRARMITTQSGQEIELALTSGAKDTELALDITVGRHRPAIAALSVDLMRAGPGDWEWRMAATAEYAPLLDWAGTLASTYAGAAVSDSIIEGNGELTATVLHPNELDFGAGPDSPDAPWRQITVNYQFSTAVDQAEINDVLSGLQGGIEGSGSLAAGQLKATVLPFAIVADINTRQLMLPEPVLQWLGWTASVPLQLQTRSPAQLTLTDRDSWSSQADDVALSLGDRNSRVNLQAQLLATAADNTGAEVLTTQVTAALNTRLRSQSLPQLNIALGQHGSPEHSDMVLKISDTAESAQVDVTGSGNFTSGEGSYQLQASIGDLSYFTGVAVPLLQHFKVLEDTVAIHSGSIRLDTAMTTGSFAVADWEQRSQLVLGDISGSLNDYSFAGLALSADWSGISRWKTLRPLELSVATLNPGFTMQQIRLRASLPTATPIARPAVRLDALSAVVFGGELVLPAPQHWDFGAASNHLTLRAQHWQLGELVALQQNTDIQAQGTLEGELPLTIADGRIIIDKGYLRALPPGGWIRYRPDEEGRAVADSSSELALALDLLDDFQYQELNSEVRLDKAGTLSLGLSLKGNNPGQYDGQAVNFNINLEQNIDPLLQSMRLNDNLVDKIESGLR
ncbi:MAG: YdbH domain-containing protein [Halioglobus sp.]|nr:YdbH domain-containing protein [Halioglobus sp.]